MVCGDNVDIIALSFGNNSEKRRQLSILRDTVTKRNADAVFILAESWYVTTDHSHVDIEPSKDPKRKECIMMTGESENGNFTTIQLFEREGGNENGKIVFGEKIDVGETTSLTFSFGIKDRKKQNYCSRDLN